MPYDGAGGWITDKLGGTAQTPPHPYYGGDQQGANDASNRDDRMGDASIGRNGAQTDNSQANSDYGQAKQNLGEQKSYGDQLHQWATGGGGPSQADVLAQKGQAQAINSQMSMAANARGGAGAQAQAYRGAQQAGSSIQEQNIADSAQRKAGEQAHYMDAYGQSLGAQQAGAQGLRAGSMQNDQFNTGLRQQQQQWNDKQQLGWHELGQKTQAAQLGADSAAYGANANMANGQADRNSSNGTGLIGAFSSFFSDATLKVPVDHPAKMLSAKEQFARMSPEQRAAYAKPGKPQWGLENEKASIRSGSKPTDMEADALRQHPDGKGGRDSRYLISLYGTDDLRQVPRMIDEDHVDAALERQYREHSPEEKFAAEREAHKLAAAAGVPMEDAQAQAYLAHQYAQQAKPSDYDLAFDSASSHGGKHTGDSQSLLADLASRKDAPKKFAATPAAAPPADDRDRGPKTGWQLTSDAVKGGAGKLWDGVKAGYDWLSNVDTREQDPPGIKSDEGLKMPDAGEAAGASAGDAGRASGESAGEDVGKAAGSGDALQSQQSKMPSMASGDTHHGLAGLISSKGQQIKQMAPMLITSHMHSKELVQNEELAKQNNAQADKAKAELRGALSGAGAPAPTNRWAGVVPQVARQQMKQQPAAVDPNQRVAPPPAAEGVPPMLARPPEQPSAVPPMLARPPEPNASMPPQNQTMVSDENEKDTGKKAVSSGRSKGTTVPWSDQSVHRDATVESTSPLPPGPELMDPEGKITGQKAKAQGGEPSFEPETGRKGKNYRDNLAPNGVVHDGRAEATGPMPGAQPPSPPKPEHVRSMGSDIAMAAATRKFQGKVQGATQGAVDKATAITSDGKAKDPSSKGAAQADKESGSSSPASQDDGNGHDAAHSFLDSLKPFEYRYKNPADSPSGRPDAAKEPHLGVMAQNVEKSKNGHVIVGEDARGKKYLEFGPMMSAMAAGVGDLHSRLKRVEGKK